MYQDRCSIWTAGCCNCGVKMTKGIFITGTDTGVGKTYVACGIAAALRSTGIDVGVMKPAETGCPARNGKLVPLDAMRLMKAAGAKDVLGLVNPYRFRKPLAPSVAARMERKSVRSKKILDSYDALSRRHDFMIVEGAGGIMVPLAGDYLFLDLAKALGLPALIVARPGLGTINHTLLTVGALRGGGIKIKGVIINYTFGGKSGWAEKTSPAVIEELSGVNILGVVPYQSVDFSGIAARLVK